MKLMPLEKELNKLKLIQAKQEKVLKLH